MIKKALLSMCVMMLVALSYTHYLDSIAQRYTEAGIERTLISFAVSRSLNGAISVVQGTQVSVSPAGVGVSFAPGQILDPVNDLVERFSWVVMLSGASLGIQRVLLEITASPLIAVLLSVLCFIYLLALWWSQSASRPAWLSHVLIKKSLILMLFIRFAIPTVALMNEGVYIYYLQPKYEKAQSQLDNASKKIQTINDQTDKQTPPIDDSLMGKLGSWLDNTQQQFDIQHKIDVLKQSVADMSRQIINLIVVFIVQTLLFPLFFLWVLIRSAKAMMGSIRC